MPISLAVNDTGFVRLLAGYKERFVKKPIIAIVIVIVLGASLAWFKRVDVMLAVVKYKAQSRHTIAGNREVVWQGDASSTSAIAAT